MTQPIRTKPIATFSTTTGNAVIVMPDGTIWKLEPNSAAPESGAGVHLGMYFQGESIAQRELDEDFPFPKLHEELKMHLRHEEADRLMLPLLDPTMTAETRTEVAMELEERLQNPDSLKFVTEKWLTTPLSGAADFPLISTDCKLGTLLAQIKEKWRPE